MQRLIWFLMFVVLMVSHINAQNELSKKSDTTKVYSDWYSFEAPAPGYGKRFLRESAVPLAVGLAGAGIMAIDSLKYPLQAALNWNRDERVCLYDDQLRYAPYAAMLVMPVFGLYPKHKPLHLMPLLISTYTFADLIVHRTKVMSAVKRPNSDGLNSFCSQHASEAFVAATVWHLEYGQYSPWISVGGYTVASMVAYSRVARNRHWVPDVLVGAAVGTISTQLVYLCYDAMADYFTTDKMAICPYMIDGGGGVYFSYSF